MSNDLTTQHTDRPTEIIPTVTPAPTRRSILRAVSAQPERPAAVPAQPERSPFADWRGQAQTEEMPAVPPSPRRRRDRPARRPALARHLRAALAGTLLAIVAISGISAYAAHGVADARQAALDHARSQVSVPR